MLFNSTLLPLKRCVSSMRHKPPSSSPHKYFKNINILYLNAIKLYPSTLKTMCFKHET